MYGMKTMHFLNLDHFCFTSTLIMLLLISHIFVHLLPIKKDTILTCGISIVRVCDIYLYQYDYVEVHLNSRILVLVNYSRDMTLEPTPITVSLIEYIEDFV